MGVDRQKMFGERVSSFITYYFYSFITFTLTITIFRASQRTAAVIILRKLYPSFREETTIVHRYAMRVIHLLCKSMRLYDHAATQQVLYTNIIGGC